LFWNMLIGGDENVEPGAFGSIEKTSVLQSCQIRETGRLTLVAAEQKP